MVSSFQGFDLMLAPAISAVNAVLVRSLSFRELDANGISVNFETLELAIVPLDADLLGAVEAVAVLLARHHRKVFHTKPEDRDVCDPFADGI